MLLSGNLCSRRCASKWTTRRHTARAARWRARWTADGAEVVAVAAAARQTRRRRRPFRSTSSIPARTSTSYTASRRRTLTSTRVSCSPCASCASTSCTGSSTCTSPTWSPTIWCCSRRTSREVAPQTKKKQHRFSALLSFHNIPVGSDSPACICRGRGARSRTARTPNANALRNVFVSQ